MPQKQDNKAETFGIGSDFDIFSNVEEFSNGQPVEQEEEQPEQPRDDKGRFVPKEEAEQQPEEQPHEAQTEAEDDAEEEDAEDGVRISRTKKGRIRVEIPNPADPNGFDTYYADTDVEALKKIAIAKKNASKRIEELKHQPVAPKEEPKPTKETKKLTADEEFEVMAKWNESPSEALDLLMKKRYGLSMDEALGKLSEFEHKQKVDAAAQSFIATNPSFIGTPKNGELMYSYIEAKGLDNTKAEDLQEAYKFLSSSGLLETKQDSSKSAQDGAPRTERKPAQPQKKASSGLFNRGGGTATPEKSNAYELSAEEQTAFDRMSLEESRAFIESKLAKLQS